MARGNGTGMAWSDGARVGRHFDYTLLTNGERPKPLPVEFD